MRQCVTEAAAPVYEMLGRKTIGYFYFFVGGIHEELRPCTSYP